MSRQHSGLYLWLLIVVDSATIISTSTATAFITTYNRIKLPPNVLASRDNFLITSTSLAAVKPLTERQLQFWEDVESGLDDIENYFSKRDQNIDRIRQFGRSARGEVDPPKGYATGHEPSEEHIDGLTAKPFWDAANMTDMFPWAAKLEENAHIIQKEFERNLQAADTQEQEKDSGLFASDSVWQTQVMGKGWSAIRLQRLGVWDENNVRAFPETYNLLRSLRIPLAVRGVCFARQAPNSGVQPHSDGRNFILTSHLGLKVPEGCWMQSGTEKRGWEVGKLTTLDTSFSHSTLNPSATEERHVLIIDYWHPELTEAEREALEFIYDLRNKFESGLIPFRRPRSLKAKEEEEGIAGWWNKLTAK